MALAYTPSLEDVRARVSAAGSSFTAGMILLPRERCEAMFGLYAFCREVDDIADDSPSLEIARQGLALWREKIRALFQGAEPDHAITRVLAPAIQRFGLVEADLQALIDGMAMDAENAICAPSMETLDLYCDRAASAVGRASVRIFGDASANAMDVAYHLGRALQLTNILRDLAEDSKRGRLYLPEELLAKHRAATRDPLKILQDPALAPICREIAAMAHDHFQKAHASMAKCRKGTMRSARVMGAYYGAILARLEKEDWKNPMVRVKLGKFEKIVLVLRSLVGL